MVKIWALIESPRRDNFKYILFYLAKSESKFIFCEKTNF